MNIKNCAKCNSDNWIFEDNKLGAGYIIYCFSCNRQTNVMTTEDEAIKVWNEGELIKIWSTGDEE